VKIELPIFPQRQPYTCVAACLRSVLAALGSEYSEEELAQACNTVPAGARLRDAAAGARSLGFDALFLGGATFETLLGWLEQDVPMIVSVAAD
jgi:ABC-type bacteriocin/lantibiotic exporter with double-glycine peptidase domain